MTSNSPGPDDGRDLPQDGRVPDGQDPSGQQQYGHPYGRAPRVGGSGLRAVYTFILVWLATALIMWFGTRWLGFERGDVGAAVVSLVVSLAAAIGITVWARKRGR